MPAAAPLSIAGISLVAHDVIDSTNADALARARAGRRSPLWIVAERQTAGRGRRGRTWTSLPGNLYATLLLIDPCADALAPQLSFVAAVALHDAIAGLAPPLAPRLTLKWPNDLLADGAKLAGILVEGERLADGAFAVAIGIGVNCLHHPADTAYRTTDLAACGAALAAGDVLVALAPALASRLAEWQGGKGFADIREAWLARSWRIGEAIVLRTPTEIAGRFAGLDADGRLLIETGEPRSLRVIAAGDLALAAGHREARA